jgi:predicted XRE-type DNA-binding protein
MDRFFKKVLKQNNHCWEWQGARIKSKGQFWHGVLRRNNQGYLAHRFSWLIHNGPIPQGQFVLHQCDNPACVNPKHLFLGTQADNVQDMMNKGRHADQRGELQSNVKLSEQQVLWIRSNNHLSRKQVAEHFGVHPATITDIIKRRTWTHI